MIVVKPEALEISSSDIQEPDLYANEIEWTPIRPYTIFGDIESFVDFTGYSGYDFLTVSGSGNAEVWRHYVFDETIFKELLFTGSGTSPMTSIGYDDGLIYVGRDIGSNISVAIYDTAGALQSTWITISSYTNDKSVICAYQGGVLVTNGLTGSSAKVAYYVDDAQVTEFDIYGLVNLVTSITTDNQYLYVYESIAGDIHRYPLFTDNLNPDDTVNTGYNSPVGYLPFDNKLYTGLSTSYFERRKITDMTVCDRWQVNDRAILTSTHKIYACAADDNIDKPSIGVNKDPKTWVEVKSTNKYSLIDSVVSNQTELLDGLTSFTVNFSLSEPYTSISGFNIDCDSIDITAGTGGAPYITTIDMTDKNEFSIYDINGLAGAKTITIEFNGTDSKAGEIVIGTQTEIGEANYGSGFGLLDFSRKETDEFGNTIIDKRRNVKTVSYDVTINTSEVPSAYKFLSSVTTIPCSYSGSKSDENTLVFAIYEDFNLTIDAPSVSNYTLSVQGLV